VSEVNYLTDSVGIENGGSVVVTLKLEPGFQFECGPDDHVWICCDCYMARWTDVSCEAIGCPTCQKPMRRLTE